MNPGSLRATFVWLIPLAVCGCDCGGGDEADGDGLALVAVRPQSGPMGGGTVLEARGGGFRDGIVVQFGGVDSQDVQVLAGDTLRAMSPMAREPGLVDIEVHLGADSATLADAFEYLAGPTIQGVEPEFGSVQGGTAVLLTGAGFVEGAEVRFGGGVAMAVTFIDAEHISAQTPPGSLGFVDVTVENPDGQVGILEDGFEYRIPGQCAIVATTPAWAARDVPVRPILRIEWSEPLNVSTLDERVILQDLAGTEIAASIESDGVSGVLVTPMGSLHFWESYGLIVAEGITDRDGSPCETASIVFSTVSPEPTARELRPAAAHGLVVTGTFAVTASPTYRGLQIYDLVDPNDVALIADVPTEVGPLSLTVSGDRLYAPAGFDGTLIFDLSDPAAPELVGRAGSPGFASTASAFAQDDRSYLAVADGVEGVRMLDVTDPEGVVDLGALDPSGARAADVRSVYVEGGLLAIANGQQGFAVASIADPSSPSLLAQIPSAPAMDVLVNGSVLYVEHGFYGTTSYDLTDAANPAQISAIEGTCTPICDNYSGRLSLSQGELLVSKGRSGGFRVTLDGSGGMEIAGTYTSLGPAYALLGDATSVFLGEEGGLQVLARDGADGAPALWFDPDGHGVAQDVAVAGAYAYVSASTRGLQTFGLNEPESPVLADRDDSPGSLSADISAYGVATGPGVVVLADGRSGLTVFDATAPMDPVETGNIEALDRIAGIAVGDGVVYACDDNSGMMIVDISSIDSPTELARIPYHNIDPEFPEQCYDMLVDGDILYVGSVKSLSVVDVSEPSSPVLLGSFPLRARDAVTSLALSGDYLMATTVLADFEARFGVTRRLQVFDVSEPTAPRRVWISDDLGGAEDVVVAGDILFVSARDLGVYVFDIADPENPFLEGLIPTPGNARGMAVTGDALYVAELEGGLQAIHTGPLPTGP